MSSFTEILGKFKRRPSDVIALDIGATGIKAVRIKKSGDGLTLVSADILPAIDLVDQPDALSVDEQQPIDLKPALKARQVAVTYSSPNAIIKLLSFPGEFDEDAEEQVGKHLGLDEETEENYRISYKIISESRQESKVLAVAFPEVLAQTINDFFPIGLPAPYTIEVAGLSSMTSFLNGPGVQHAEDTVGVLDFGASQSFYSLFHQGQLALIRKFDFGVNSIVDKVTKSLGVDKQTAEGILADGSFDISQPMAEVMGPFIKQLIISRDFVERR